VIWLVLSDPDFGCNSYLLGDEVAGIGMVVDPLGRVGAEAYILAAQDVGLTLEHVVETHVHADHASAAQELADLLGLRVTLSRHAPAAFPFIPVADGDVIPVGAVQVTAWETPGHTPDSLSLLVHDTGRGEEPWLVMTGDSLFVGDVGRPDLADADAEAVRAAAAQQFQSVRRLMSLPDFVEVHPAHYGSSPCGGLFMSRKPSSTIGYERRMNRMAQFTEEFPFIEQQLALLKPPPEEAAALRRRNLGRGEERAG
jgi:glyoxylase-like metal-dependent hydrolase (beta-lactamase superfamily II)